MGLLSTGPGDNLYEPFIACSVFVLFLILWPYFSMFLLPSHKTHLFSTMLHISINELLFIALKQRNVYIQRFHISPKKHLPCSGPYADGRKKKLF